jgi:hypothetical protein
MRRFVFILFLRIIIYLFIYLFILLFSDLIMSFISVNEIFLFF